MAADLKQLLLEEGKNKSAEISFISVCRHGSSAPAKGSLTGQEEFRQRGHTTDTCARVGKIGARRHAYMSE